MIPYTRRCPRSMEVPGGRLDSLLICHRRRNPYHVPALSRLTVLQKSHPAVPTSGPEPALSGERKSHRSRIIHLFMSVSQRYATYPNGSHLLDQPGSPVSKIILTSTNGFRTGYSGSSPLSQLLQFPVFHSRNPSRYAFPPPTSCLVVIAR
jgi:hypothetical protein